MVFLPEIALPNVAVVIFDLTPITSKIGAKQQGFDFKCET